MLLREPFARRFQEVPFERVRYIADYDAIVDSQTGVIEAQLQFSGPSGSSSANSRMFSGLPGVEDLSETRERPLDADDVDIDESAYPTRSLENWRLVLPHASAAVEISPGSRLFAGMRVRRISNVTMKISGLPSEKHEEALETLETVGGAALFDLDLRYHRSFTFSRQATRALRSRVEPVSAPPEFPRNRYARDALSLYEYGRSSSGLPLLEFLAYYQVLEFFFPVFTRDELIRQLRSSLKDPRFDAEDDVALGRVLNRVTSTSRGGPTEREQLRATVRACMDASVISDFVNSSTRVQNHFCGKNQAIKGVSKLTLSTGHPDYRDQVADRIYQIRCRVVHTKQDGGDAGVDLLLPSSREARSLAPDIELLRMIAQQAIITAAAPLRV